MTTAAAGLAPGEALGSVDPRTVGFVSSVPARRDPARPGGLWLQEGNRRNFCAITGRFRRAVIMVSVLPSLPASDTTFLEWPEEDLIVLPPIRGIKYAPPHYPAVRRLVREMAARVDCLVVRMPFALPWALRGLGKPKVLHLAADAMSHVKDVPSYRGAVRQLAIGYASLMDRATRALAAEPQTRVIANGRPLAERFSDTRPAKAIVSSALLAREMGAAREAAPGATPRLLFVGYLRPHKGIGVLLDAFDRLRATRPVTLTLAGASDTTVACEGEYAARIARSPFARDITMLGAVPFGPELFQQYREHDVLVVPSLTEGTPRVAVEARAFGCPVVASRVGGIPDSVRHEEDGLLVPPNDPAALAAALDRLLTDRDLYLRLSKAGHTRALREFSMDAFSQHFVDAAVEAAADPAR